MAVFRFQYQQYTAPVLVPLSIFGWFNGLSEPVQIEPGLSAAWQQVTSVGTANVELQTGIYPEISPLSEPVRAKPPLPEGAKQHFSTDSQWIVGVPSIGWLEILSEPVLYSQILGAEYQPYFQASGIVPPTDLQSFWHEALSEPVRVKASLREGAHQHFSTDWQWTIVTPTVTFPLSEPVRVRQWLGATSQQFFTTDAKWDAPAPRVDSWHKLLSEPVRYKTPVTWQQPFTIDWKFERPAVQNFPNWYAWLSEPVRQKLGLLAADQQFFTIDWKWDAPAPRADSWHKWLSEPVRFKVPVAWQQPFTTDWQWTVPTVTFVAGPLSEPVRVLPRVVYQQPYTTDWKWLRPSAKAPDWVSPLTEPVRSKPPFAPARQQFFATDTIWKAPATTTFAGWHQALREPVQVKPSLRTALQQAYTADWRTPQATLGSWYQWLREPVRLKPALRAANQQFFTTDWSWGAPPIIAITYTLSAIERGDTGQLVYVGNSLVMGANVTLTEIRVGDMANVTISELDP